MTRCSNSETLIHLNHYPSRRDRAAANAAWQRRCAAAALARLLALVAREGEARCAAVDLHRAAERLLRRGGHAARGGVSAEGGNAQPRRAGGDTAARCQVGVRAVACVRGGVRRGVRVNETEQRAEIQLDESGGRAIRWQPLASENALRALSIELSDKIVKRRPRSAPVGLVEEDNLVAAGRHRHLLLREHLDLVAHDVDASATREWMQRVAVSACTGCWRRRGQRRRQEGAEEDATKRGKAAVVPRTCHRRRLARAQLP